jgi:ribonuclease HI
MKEVEGLATREENLIVYSDGSLLKKNGFSRAGAGVVMYHKGVEVKARTMGLGGNAEVYDAEMAGLMMGSKMATRFARRNPEIKHIHFFADNASAVKCIFVPKPQPGQHYAAIFNSKLRTFLDSDDTHHLSIKWCPGHADVPGNERADTLAKGATSLGWSAPIGTTRANALRHAKMSTERAWILRWKKSTKNGGFAMANTIPPSLRPTKCFMEIPREVLGRTIQCQTGHAYTGEFRRRFFPGQDVDCHCGEPYQTREHILIHCPRYDEHRTHLRKVSRYISLPVILGSAKGISALALFLQKSGAFTMHGRPIKKREPPLFDDKPEINEE